jgi:5-methylcytosine-specific restriction endonuclease McrA
VRQLCRRKSGVVQSGVVQSGAVQSGATASLFAEPAPAPTEPVTASINLRGDALQVARFEALLEKAQKLGLVPAGADRLDAVLAGLEALVSGQTASTAGPATQIIIHQCPDCGSAATVTRRGELPLAPAQVATAACDARICRAGGVNRATIPPKTRAVVLARDRHRCSTPGCGATHFLEVHHVVSRARGGSNRAENLMTLCGRCHRFHHERDEGALVPAQVLSAQVANAQVLRPQVENAQAANAQAANAQAASAPRCDLERHQGRR